MVMSPMLWAKHSPDRFDIYSAGLVLMQLAIPQLRSDRGLLAFNEAIKKADYDLEAWRGASRHGFAKQNAVLDADDGAGWKLAAAMLRKRTLEVNPPRAFCARELCILRLVSPDSEERHKKIKGPRAQRRTHLLN